MTKNPAAVQLGALGASKGGLARAAALSPERRSEIASAAARARWSGDGRPAKPARPSDELHVLAKTYRLLSALNRDEQERALRWLSERLRADAAAAEIARAMGPDAQPPPASSR